MIGLIKKIVFKVKYTILVDIIGNFFFNYLYIIKIDNSTKIIYIIFYFIL